MIQQLAKCRLICVTTASQPAAAVQAARALYAGGLKAIEIALRTKEAVDCLAAVRAEVPEMLVGAGTVLTLEQLEQTRAAGAQFAMAPGLNETIVKAAQAAGLPFFPGVMTPSEIERALQLGCRAAKFFPAEAAGGISMLRALAGPYAHTGLRLIPTGGIYASNLADYLEFEMVAAVGGSWMVDPKLMQANDWPKIAKLAAEAARLTGRHHGHHRSHS